MALGAGRYVSRSLCLVAIFTPNGAGRVYAAYGGVYIFVAILWLWAVDGIRPTLWDVVGACVAMLGMAIIMFAPRDV